MLWYSVIVPKLNRTKQRISRYTIQGGLIELLKIIEVIMHAPERTKYPFASLTE